MSFLEIFPLCIDSMCIFVHGIDFIIQFLIHYLPYLKLFIILKLEFLQQVNYAGKRKVRSHPWIIIEWRCHTVTIHVQSIGAHDFWIPAHEHTCREFFSHARQPIVELSLPSFTIFDLCLFHLAINWPWYYNISVDNANNELRMGNLMEKAAKSDRFSKRRKTVAAP